MNIIPRSKRILVKRTTSADTVHSLQTQCTGGDLFGNRLEGFVGNNAMLDFAPSAKRLCYKILTGLWQDWIGVMVRSAPFPSVVGSCMPEIRCSTRPYSDPCTWRRISVQKRVPTSNQSMLIIILCILRGSKASWCLDLACEC